MDAGPAASADSGAGALAPPLHRAPTHKYSWSAPVGAAPQAVFAHLDDQTRLAAHMQSRSPMMGGGRMTYVFDSGLGQAVGSHIRMGGSAFGLAIEVDEVITERAPPLRKVWRTTGAPRLLIMSSYEMGFSIAPIPAGSHLRVWIDYEPPSSFLWRWLTAPLAALYARWCVRRMVSDAVRVFGTNAAA